MMRNVFLVLAIIVSLYINTFAQTNRQSKQNTLQAENVLTFCSLMAEPDKYLGQSVTIKDIYVAGFEQTWFGSVETCAVPKEKRKRIDLKFDTSWRESSDQKTIKKWDKLLSLKGKKVFGQRKINVVVEGEFVEYRKQNEFDKRYDLEFVVKKVTFVSKVKI